MSAPESPYPNLFSPITIRGTTIRNRLVQSAHSRSYSDAGVESDRDIAYFVERAKGGVGLISVGSTVVHPTGSLGMGGGGYSFLPESIVALQRLTNAVHAEGAAIFSQLNHCGPSAISSVLDGYGVLWGPSEISWSYSGEQCKVMEKEDIDQIIAAFAEAANVAQRAGCDGVEISIHHDYMLGSFFSPVLNRRTDEYGGSLENRLRLAKEVVGAVRRRVGEHFVVGVRLSLAEEIPGGFTLEDTCTAANILKKEVGIDFVTLSTGGGPTQWMALPTGYLPNGHLLDRIAIFKKAVGDTPVFAIGGIDDPAMAEEVLEKGSADMIVITRGQIADPFFAKKAREGRADEITHCIRGNQGCAGRVAAGKPLGCTVNPAAGRERYFGEGTQTSATKPGKWLVIGGGPAGMKAAEGLAQRGHRVTLLEREKELGGIVNLITRLPSRANWHWIKTDLGRSLDRLGVNVMLGQEATAEFVLKEPVDGVLLATGSTPDESGRSVMGAPPAGLGTAHVMTINDAIMTPKKAGKRVLILDDEGQLRIAGVADLLLQAGSEVMVVSRHNSLFPHIATTGDMPPAYKRLLSAGMTYELLSWVARVEGRKVSIVNLVSRQERVLDDIDTIVLGTTRHPQISLYQQLRGKVKNLHRIGDCLAARTMDHAIYEGFLAGRELLDFKERPFFERARNVNEPIQLAT